MDFTLSNFAYKKCWVTMLPGVFLVFLSGCSLSSFFDVPSAMCAPRFSDIEQEVNDLICRYMVEDIIWKYPKFKEKYSSILDTYLGKKHEKFYVAFCSSIDEIHKIHILFLKNEDSKWVIFKDVILSALDIQEVGVQDIDNDGIDEFIVLAKNFEAETVATYAYKYDGNDLFEVAVSDDFFNGTSLDNMEDKDETYIDSGR